MNIFYFGGTSFASQHLVQDLNKKFDVSCFSRRKVNNCRSHYINLEKNMTKSFIARLNNSKPDYIFFFSSLVPIKEQKSTWKECKQTNVMGLINLLKNIKFKPKKIILSSSCSVYGSENKKYVEKSFLKPPSGYSLTKFSQENILRVFCSNNNIKFLCYRLGYVFGDNMSGRRLVKKIWLKIKNKKFFFIYNKGKNLNLIHTKDIGKIVISTFKKAEGIFNLTTPYKTSLGSFYSLASTNIESNKFFYKNNYSPALLFNCFKKIKIFKFNDAINEFKNGN